MAAEDVAGSSSTTPAKRPRPDFNDTIQVLVGPTETPFILHKEVVCSKSPFFKAACSREWKEGQANIIRLSEQDPDCFHVFVHHAYSGELDMDFIPELEDMTGSSIDPPSYTNLSNAWIMGSYLQDNTFCNAIINCTLQKFEDLPDSFLHEDVLTYVWEHTAPDSKLRKLYTHRTVAKAPPWWIKRHWDKIPVEILGEMAHKFATGRVRCNDGPRLAERCRYHVHDEGEGMCEQ